MGAEAAVGQGPALRGLQGRPVLPARRHVALQPRGLAGLQGRRGPERLRPLPGHQAGGRAARGRHAARVDDDARGRWSPTPRSPSTPSSPTCARPRATCWPRRSSRACSARTPQVADRFKGADMVGAGYEPPFPFIPASEYGEKGHTVLPADFVSAEDGTGIVHTAIAFGEDDFRLGAEHGPERHQPGARPTAPTTSASARTRASSSRTPTTTWSRTSRRAGGCSAPSACCTATRTAGAAARRCSTTPSRPGTSACPRSRTGCWRPTRPSTGTPSTSSTAASGAGWRTTSTGRSGASATGARRCRSGATRPARRSRSAPSRSCSELSGVELEDPHRPYVDDVEIPSPTGGEPLRRVPEVIDVWFDSGSMPFAQWHAPFENQDKFERAVPGGLHLRGDRPDARLVLLADRDLDAAVRPQLLQDRASASATSPTPRARRCRSRSATSSCRGTSSTATARTPSAGTS